MKKATISIAISAMLAGCAAPPNTPGAGYGKNYTPLIDTQGLDQAQYSKDLDDCRKYAGIIDADKAAMNGMIGGILVGAIIGAIAGHQNGMTNYGANYGATLGGGAGLGAAANKATNQQERIMTNCLAGRGYRTLDGAATTPNAAYPSPYVQPAARTAQQPQPSAVYVAPPIQRNANTDFMDGKEKYQAEKFAQQQACVLPLKAGPSGAGFETYSAVCINGDTMMIRCEFGNCRALK